MEIRILNAADAPVFQHSRLEALHDCPIAFASSLEEEQEKSLEEVASRLQPQPSGATFGAFHDTRLIGVVGVKQEAHRKLAHKAFLWGVYVQPAFRRQAVGLRLLAEALEHAFASLEVRQVNLSVNSELRPATGLYEKLGFEIFGREKAYLQMDGVYYDQLHMVCFRDTWRRIWSDI